MRRLSISGMMFFVMICGVGFAALRIANAFWASVTFTLALIAVSTAIVGAIARRGQARLPWVGFAVFGGAYLLVDLLPPRPVGSLGAGPVEWPGLLIEWGTASLQPYVHPWAVGSSDWVHYDQISHSLGMILFALLGAGIGRLVGMPVTDGRRE